ncbi:hypothetical protein ACLMJK_009409 [Lecanora helva]
MPKLYLTMYRAVKGNYEHWALYLDGEHKIYELTGESPHFKRNVVSGIPTSSNRHKRSIFVSDINTGDFAAFQSAVGAIKPNNSVSHWNCQDYVTGILEKLEEECIVDADEKAYKTAKNRVKSHYGPL